MADCGSGPKDTLAVCPAAAQLTSPSLHTLSRLRPSRAGINLTRPCGIMRYCGITRAPPNLPSHGQHGPRVLTHSALPGLQWPVGPCPQPSPPGGHPTAVAPAVVCAPLMFPISRSHSSPRPTPNWASGGCPGLPPLPPTNFTCLLAPVALAGDGVVAVYCCDPASWLGSVCVQHAPSSVGCVWPVGSSPPVSDQVGA